MEPHAIFLDIDGTLTLPGGSEPPASALAAIDRARENGHKVLIATGRNRLYLGPLWQKHGSHFDGYVCCNGAVINIDGEFVFDQPLTPKEKEAELSLLSLPNFYCAINMMDSTYTDPNFVTVVEAAFQKRIEAGEATNSELERMRKHLRKNQPPLSEYKGEDFYKIVLLTSDLDKLLELKEQWKGFLNVVIMEERRRGLVNAEVISAACDKGTALRETCRILGIPVIRSVAYGDSMNDKEMILAAGLGICMGNGSEEMKALADRVCGSVTEDGLYRSFAELGLI